MAHRRARLTPFGRLLIVQRVDELGWTVAEAASAAGVSRSTAHKWVRRYREEGEAGLVDRSSRPRHCPNALPPRTVQAVLHKRATLKRGPHHLASVLSMPRSTVYGILRRHGVSRLDHTDRPTGATIRYCKDHPGELVHVDVKKLGRIPEGGGWRMLGRSTSTRRRGGGYDYLHAAVDDHSRLAYVEVHPDERGETCARFLAGAAAFYASHGIRIQAVMTDKRPELRSLRGLPGGHGHPGDPPPAHPRLPPPGQRQSRAVQPDHGRGVGLRPAVHLQQSAPPGPPSVARVLQFTTSSHRVGRPASDQSGVNNAGGNYT